MENVSNDFHKFTIDRDNISLEQEHKESLEKQEEDFKKERQLRIYLVLYYSNIN